MPGCREVRHGWGDGGVSVYPDETILAHAVNDLARSSARVVLDWAEWRERALAAEARVRDLEETVGELVALDDGTWRA
jgi:hypothetical protein